LYICHCNALTDTDIQQAAAQGACRPREVYEACGCIAQCGSCTRRILALLQEAQMEQAAEPALVAAIG
jgi:bacterioferritin-associated ferredoxin